VVIDRAADGGRVGLNKRSIIVNAAKQRQGHLYVQTKEMTVCVVGTVFLVKAEEAGSRVAVVQGEVNVREGTSEKQLRPVEHIATYLSLKLPSVREEISCRSNRPDGRFRFSPRVDTRTRQHLVARGPYRRNGQLPANLVF
jgi:hypothetical protein